MKVLFVNRFFYPDHSATSQLVSDLAFHLADSGYTVAVVTSRLGYQGREPVFAGREQVGGVEIYRTWTSHFGRSTLLGRAIDYLTFYVSSFWCLLRLARSDDVIVAKTDPPLISVVVGCAAFLRGARLVNWIQDLFPEVAVALGVRSMGGRVGSWVAGIRNLSLRYAKRNVVIGELMAKRLFAVGIAQEGVRVINNWVDGEAIRPIEHCDNPLRQQWQVDGKFVVGYSGNLGLVHEYETMLGAIKCLGARQDIVFLFIGGGALFAELQDACDELGLSNARFLPYQPVERLRQSLGACDAHLIVLRADMEGLVVPSKVYGVEAAGRPALFIGDPEGEVARMIAEDNSGIAVASGDDQGLVDAVLRLQSDVGYRVQLGSNARRAFDARYTRGRALKQWESVLCSEPASVRDCDQIAG